MEKGKKSSFYLSSSMQVSVLSLALFLSLPVVADRDVLSAILLSNFSQIGHVLFWPSVIWDWEFLVISSHAGPCGRGCAVMSFERTGRKWLCISAQIQQFYQRGTQLQRHILQTHSGRVFGTVWNCEFNSRPYSQTAGKTFYKGGGLIISWNAAADTHYNNPPSFTEIFFSHSLL